MSESTTTKSDSAGGSVDLPGVGAAVSDGRRRLSYAILALACAAGLGVMLLKHGPRSANAADTAPAGSESALNDQLTNQVAGLRQMDAALAANDKVIAGFRFSPARVQVPLSDLRVNPFRTTSTRGALDDSIQTPRPAQDR